MIKNIYAGFLFISFLNWTQVIRFANHAGYFVGTLEKCYLANIEKKKMNNAAALGRHMAQSATGDLSPPNTEGTEKYSDLQLNSTHTTIMKLSDVELDQCRDTFARREVQIMVTKMTEHFSWGFRSIYFAIPFWCYSAGPVALVVATALTLMFLFMFDFPRPLTNTKNEQGEDSS